MAQSSATSKRLAELVKNSEASRLVLFDIHAGLMHAVELPARLKSAMFSSPVKWLGGSMLAGLVASLLFRSGKMNATSRLTTAKKEHGIMLGLLSLAFSLSKPALKVYATKLLKDYLARRLTAGQRSNHANTRTPPY